MKQLIVLQVVVAILLILSILLQNRGAGLGSTFGGDFSGYHAKRGLEKFLVRATVGLACLFVLLAGLNVWYFQRPL